MIKINILESVRDAHWNWFKDKMLINWLIKIRNLEDEKLINFFWNPIKEELGRENIMIVKKKEIMSLINSKYNFSHIKKLIIGNYSNLLEVKKIIGDISSKKSETYFRNQYKTKFRDTSIANEWSAYHLVNELNISVCPYCNRQKFDLYEVDGKYKLNGEIDHYFPVSKYPYFSVSLENLIPSCNSCNSDKSDLISNLIHPYTESLVNQFKFETEFNDEFDLRYLFGKSDKFNIVLKSFLSANRKLDESIETFNLDKLYSLDKEIAQDIIAKTYIYNTNKIQELRDTFNYLFKDREEVINLIFDVQLDKRNFSNILRGKYKLDIFSDFFID